MTKSRLSFHIGANTSEAEKAFKEFEKRFDRFSKKVSGAGKAWSAYISAPLAGVGALAAKFAKDVDDALDDIRIGTGATGSALRALGEDFRAVAANVPQNFAESSKAIADLNTMLGATGKELQALATAGLDASRMMKLDLGAVISSASKAMNNWGISASNGVSLMDKLFVASQSTGAGIDRIADGLSRFGPAFRALGFESEQAMAIIAQFDKYGVQTDAVLGSLNKALSTLAKAGIKDAGQAFEQIIGSIRDAKDGQSAMTLAAQVFGTKVGASWVQAIREGKINIDDLVRALRGADGSIRKTAKATDGFAEQLERTKNALALALEPLGTQLLAIAEEELKSLAETLKGVNLEFNSATVKIGLFVAGIGPALVGLASLVRAFKELIGVMKLMASLSPLGPAAVVGAVGYGAYARKRDLNKLQNDIKDAAEAGDKEGFVKLRAQEITNYNQRSVNNQDLLRRTQAAHGGEALLPKPASSVKKARERMEWAAKEAEKEWAEKYENKRDRLLSVKPLSAPDGVADKGLTPDSGADISELLEKLSKGAKAGSASRSAAELFAETARDHMKYLGEDGTKYLAQVEAMQAKLKPLTDDWKILEDLKIGINEDAFDKGLREIQNKIRYLGANGVDFLPDLEKMKAGLDPLSEEAIRLSDAIKSVTDEQARNVAEIENGKWAERSWLFSQGFLAAGEYADMLRGKLAGLTPEAEEYMETFAKLQGVMGGIASEEAEKLNKALEKNKITTEEWRAEVDKFIEDLGAEYPKIRRFWEDLKVEQEEDKKRVSELDKLTVKWTEDFQSGIADAIVEGRDLGDVLSNIGKELAKMAIKTALFGGDGQLGLFGGLFAGMFGNAKGNAFFGGRVTPFAMGGVVVRPTVFPMANGMGLMGEAGPEAVMPLSRDSRGRLGVRAEGGDPNVVIHVENRASTPVRADQVSVTRDDMRRIVVGVLLEDQASNGPISRNYRR